MATLGGVLIAATSSGFDSGAAMLLLQKCSSDEIVRLASGWEVEVRAGSPYVVARTSGLTNATNAFDAGMEAVQEGLDLLSITGKGDFSTKDAFDEHLIWWRQLTGQVLRCVATSVITLSASATLMRRDANGNIIPPPPPPTPVYHDALRYFRLSQVSDDLFDSFRSLYLAFELLLAHVAPKTENREREWLHRALRQVDALVPLAPAYSSKSGNVVEEIYKDIYQGVRCKIFHAKSRDYLTPQHAADRAIVSAAYDKLSRIVLLIAEKVLNATRIGGGITFYGFELGAKPLAENSTALVSDNPSPFDKSETIESAFSNSIAMDTRHAPELSSPGRIAVLGEVECTKLSSLRAIRRFGLKNSNKLMACWTVEADLMYEGIDLLQGQHNLQMKVTVRPNHPWRVV
jgi:hypothetical protein